MTPVGPIDVVQHKLPAFAKLRTIPALHHRVSPQADRLASKFEDDTAIAVPLFVVAERTLPPPRPCQWNVSRFEQMTGDYPFPRVREIALTTMRGELDPFVGDHSKAVDQPPRQYADGVAMKIRTNLVMQGHDEGLLAGPIP